MARKPKPEDDFALVTEALEPLKLPFGPKKVEPETDFDAEGKLKNDPTGAQLHGPRSTSERS